MCYMVRQQQQATQAGAGTTPPSIELRPRWLAAAGAALIASFAVAALVVPSGTSSRADVRDTAAPLPVASRTAATPAGPVLEQTSLSVDDDVPTAPGASRAGAGNCHHGL